MLFSLMLLLRQTSDAARLGEDSLRDSNAEKQLRLDAVHWQLVRLGPLQGVVCCPVQACCQSQVLPWSSMFLVLLYRQQEAAGLLVTPDSWSQ